MRSTSLFAWAGVFAIALGFGLIPSKAWSFVTLDTSTPAPIADSVGDTLRAQPAPLVMDTARPPDTQAPASKADSLSAQSRPSQPLIQSEQALPSEPLAQPISQTPGVATTGSSTAGIATREPEAPKKYPVVLFLSADDYEVYAALGVMAALQDYGLRPDAIVAESRSALVGAALALGYPASYLEKVMLTDPPDAWVLPFTRPEPDASSAEFSQVEPFPFALTLSGQSLQNERGLWLHAPQDEMPEYLHLAWLIARLAQGAPRGPVPLLQQTPIPLALQVYDADAGGLRTVAQGDLQDLLKACLLPPVVARERTSVRPFSDGAQVSSHDIQLRNLPFGFEHILAIRISRHLPRRMFGGEAPNWRDSLNHGYHENRRFRLDSLANEGKLDFIDVQPDAQGLLADSPILWRDLGYQAALHHMDLLMKSLTSMPKPQAEESPEEQSQIPISIDPLASGGRELLLDLLQENPLTTSWSSGEKAMKAVMATGFYSQLDVAWQPENSNSGEEWVFTAKEQSKIEVWGAPHILVTPEALSMRAPEWMAGLSWSEPLFIPLKFEVMGDIGGRQPGWALQGFAQPLAPLPLRVGMRQVQTDMNHIDFDRLSFNHSGDRFGTSNFRMRDKTTGLFLDFLPNSPHRVGSEVNMRTMRYGLMTDGVDSLRTQLEAKAYLCLGCDHPPAQAWHAGMRLDYRSAETVSEGSVKPTQFTLSARQWLFLPYSKVLVDWVWTNYSADKIDVYDLYTGPQIDALSFADQFFFLGAKALRFTNVRGELLPRLGRLQGRLALGYVQHHGSTLLADKNNDSQTYWEADLSYPTFLGPLRFGVGQFADFEPLFLLQFGVNLDLRQALERSRL